MRTRLRRIKLRDAALFALVAAAVAVSTVCGAQEPGLDGERTDAGTQAVQDEPAQSQVSQEQEQAAEPLSLTMTGPSRCVTDRGQSYGTDVDIHDDEGNYLRSERRFTSHRGVKQFQVTWSVSGGSGPYRLTIDGASEDRSGPFSGVSGQGMVFCAATDVPSYIDDAGNRGFRADPMIDSGVKTVRAVVTDTNGRTAQTSIEVYVVLIWTDPQQILRGGETYRVEGWEVTIPDGLTLRAGGYEESDCEVTEEIEEQDPHFCENLNILFFETDEHRVSIAIEEDSGQERARTVRVKGDVRGDEASQLERRLNTLLSEFAESVRRP